MLRRAEYSLRCDESLNCSDESFFMSTGTAGGVHAVDSSPRSIRAPSLVNKRSGREISRFVC